MSTGRTPTIRNAVQRLIEQAGAEGITSEAIAEQLKLDSTRVHAAVNHLRKLGLMPVAARRAAGKASRYWASPDLVPTGITTLTQRIIAWLVANPAGGTAEEVACGVGADSGAVLRAGMVSSLLSQIAANGHAVSRPAPLGKAVRRRHYYAAQHAALMPAQPPKPEKPVRLLSLAPAAFDPGEADYSRAKVTVCPAGVDTRFTFTPPPGWKGTITRDWQERRLQEQHHGR